ncbi:hypothetical protein V3C99_009189 [Haemonchus contortus]|uniref:G_PROTEIN_RECEP_F1_2 domain-containing protein n=1 Tax=Haemonchus contortus TaxID=6289 RepID=A0A7I4YIR8_HAECO
MEGDPVNGELREDSFFIELMGYHKINIELGAICAVFSMILIWFLVTSKEFRRNRKLIITLAVADTFNCVGILLMGMNRHVLYGSVLQSGRYGSETSWTCARQPWLLVKTIGDVWPPIVQCFMGTEQLFAAITCAAPNKRQNKSRSDILVVTSIIFVIAVVGTGYTLAFISRSNGNVKYYCGRKATFGKKFSSLIYTHNIIGYASGVVLNLFALLKARKVKGKCLIVSMHQSEHIHRIRSCLIVSILATILVSIPNCLSIVSVLVGSVRDRISKPAVWATCVCSGVNLFVYLVIDREFRQHVTTLWKGQKATIFCTEGEQEESSQPLSPPPNYQFRGKSRSC